MKTRQKLTSLSTILILFVNLLTAYVPAAYAQPVTAEPALLSPLPRWFTADSPPARPDATPASDVVSDAEAEMLLPLWFDQATAAQPTNSFLPAWFTPRPTPLAVSVTTASALERRA